MATADDSQNGGSDYATDNESLCEFLDDDLRNTISELAEARGQMSGGVVKAGIKQIEKHYEARIIEFNHSQHARDYYRHHKQNELEFEGAYEELSEEGYYGTPAQPLHELLQQRSAEHKEKANTAARWLDQNDPDIHVVVNEYGSPEEVPQIDRDLDIQHGSEVEQ